MSCDASSIGGDVNVAGAHVGQLSMRDATLASGLSAEAVRVDQDMNCARHISASQEVNLRGSRIGQNLLFSGATLHAGLVTDGLDVGQVLRCDAGFTANGPVSLLGSHIGKQLIFRDATLTAGLDAGQLHTEVAFFDEHFRCDGALDLQHARFYAISFRTATLTGNLIAAGVVVEERMLCDGGFSTGGSVILLAARIGDQLSFTDATLGQGLEADGVRVGGDLTCDGAFRSRGPVRLRAAHIGRQLRLRGAKLEAELDASQIEVAMDLYLDNGFQVPGDVTLQAARIGGQLVLNDAKLGGDLIADMLRVDQATLCERMTVLGDLSLRKARLAELTFTDAILLGTPRGLLLRDAQIDGALVMHFAMAPVGLVVLTSAQMTTLYDSERTWPARVRLDGCVYSGVHAREDAATADAVDGTGVRPRLAALVRWRPGRRVPADVRRRLRWIRRAEEGARLPAAHLPPAHVHGAAPPGPEPDAEDQSPSAPPERPSRVEYATQPYTHLSKLYREQGRDGDARRVAYEQMPAPNAAAPRRQGLEPVPALDRRLRLQAAASARLARRPGDRRNAAVLVAAQQRLAAGDPERASTVRGDRVHDRPHDPRGEPRAARRLRTTGRRPGVGVRLRTLRLGAHDRGRRRSQRRGAPRVSHRPASAGRDVLADDDRLRTAGRLERSGRKTHRRATEAAMQWATRRGVTGFAMPIVGPRALPVLTGALSDRRTQRDVGGIGRRDHAEQAPLDLIIFSS